jgi:hypothetical protein
MIMISIENDARRRFFCRFHLFNSHITATVFFTILLSFVCYLMYFFMLTFLLHRYVILYSNHTQPFQCQQKINKNEKNQLKQFFLLTYLDSESIIE